MCAEEMPDETPLSPRSSALRSGPKHRVPQAQETGRNNLDPSLPVFDRFHVPRLFDFLIL